MDLAGVQETVLDAMEPVATPITIMLKLLQTAEGVKVQGYVPDVREQAISKPISYPGFMIMAL